MQRRLTQIVAVLLLGWSGIASAQVPEWVTQILVAAALPVSAAEARREGVPNDEIRTVLEAMRRANIPAHDARVLIDEERQARREHGPVDNFGAFVQSKLDAGLRGRDLAAAIKAEHAARGRGKGQGAPGQSKGASQGQTKGNRNAASDTNRGGRGKAGPPDRSGKSDASRPDTKGKSPDRPTR